MKTGSCRTTTDDEGRAVQVTTESPQEGNGRRDLGTGTIGRRGDRVFLVWDRLRRTRREMTGGVPSVTTTLCRLLRRPARVGAVRRMDVNRSRPGSGRERVVLTGEDRS